MSKEKSPGKIKLKRLVRETIGQLNIAPGKIDRLEYLDSMHHASRAAVGKLNENYSSKKIARKLIKQTSRWPDALDLDSTVTSSNWGDFFFELSTQIVEHEARRLVNEQNQEDGSIHFETDLNTFPPKS